MGLQNFQKHPPKLTNFNISGLPLISDIGIITCIEAIAPYINTLDMSLLTPTNVTDAIGDALKKCVLLEILDLSGCSDISDDCFKKMFPEDKPDEKDIKKPLLKVLCVNNLQYISEECFIKIINVFSLLKKVELINGYIGDQFLEELGHSDSEIKYLNMNLCSTVTKEGVEKLKALKPSCVVIWEAPRKVEKRDNGLRMPLLLKKKKKKKAKKSSKKK